MKIGNFGFVFALLLIVFSVTASAGELITPFACTETTGTCSAQNSSLVYVSGSDYSNLSDWAVVYVEYNGSAIPPYPVVFEWKNGTRYVFDHFTALDKVKYLRVYPDLVNNKIYYSYTNSTTGYIRKYVISSSTTTVITGNGYIPFGINEESDLLVVFQCPAGVDVLSSYWLLNETLRANTPGTPLCNSDAENIMVGAKYGDDKIIIFAEDYSTGALSRRIVFGVNATQLLNTNFIADGGDKSNAFPIVNQTSGLFDRAVYSTDADGNFDIRLGYSLGGSAQTVLNSSPSDELVGNPYTNPLGAVFYPYLDESNNKTFYNFFCSKDSTPGVGVSSNCNPGCSFGNYNYENGTSTFDTLICPCPVGYEANGSACVQTESATPSLDLYVSATRTCGLIDAGGAVASFLNINPECTSTDLLIVDGGRLHLEVRYSINGQFINTATCTATDVSQNPQLTYSLPLGVNNYTLAFPRGTLLSTDFFQHYFIITCVNATGDNTEISTRFRLERTRPTGTATVAIGEKTLEGRPLSTLYTTSTPRIWAAVSLFNQPDAPFADSIGCGIRSIYNEDFTVKEQGDTSMSLADSLKITDASGISRSEYNFYADLDNKLSAGFYNVELSCGSGSSSGENYRVPSIAFRRGVESVLKCDATNSLSSIINVDVNDGVSPSDVNFSEAGGLSISADMRYVNNLGQLARVATYSCSGTLSFQDNASVHSQEAFTIAPGYRIPFVKVDNSAHFSEGLGNRFEVGAGDYSLLVECSSHVNDLCISSASRSVNFSLISTVCQDTSQSCGWNATDPGDCEVCPSRYVVCEDGANLTAESYCFANKFCSDSINIEGLTPDGLFSDPCALSHNVLYTIDTMAYPVSTCFNPLLSISSYVGNYSRSPPSKIAPSASGYSCNLRIYTGDLNDPDVLSDLAAPVDYSMVYQTDRDVFNFKAADHSFTCGQKYFAQVSCAGGDLPREVLSPHLISFEITQPSNCQDGTESGACSLEAPLYCDETFNLIDRPSVCGCPEGSTIMSTRFSNGTRVVYEACEEKFGLQAASWLFSLSIPAVLLILALIILVFKEKRISTSTHG